ncbi:MAG: MoxR family ATPase [Chloroflexota bacterium]
MGYSKLYPHGEIGRFKGDGQQSFYYAVKDLRDAVNLAIALGRPLLVRGEPGTGKTSLARAIAAELTEGRIYEWRIKSTDKVQDGLYVYDTVRRLMDAQIEGRDADKTQQQKALNPYNYISLTYLGKAIAATDPVVLLIDEIDKADIDFPNDLLRELDEMWFDVKEVAVETSQFDLDSYATEQQTMDEKAILAAARTSPQRAEEYAVIHGGKKVRPIVIITSNDEKPLPMAFLRRCIVHHIKFPDLNASDPLEAQKNREQVRKITHSSTKDRFDLEVERLKEDVIKRVIEIFAVVRKQSLFKQPATAELVEWVVALHHPAFEGEPQPTTHHGLLPYWELMFKDEADRKKIIEVFAQNPETAE